ncbi:ATP-binding protein [Azorhizobium sp. AG788]|uniref:ATP-binding protein n=1 Tax=Azorhizobium sp. AG788 TaxID=2183897 RepID=UPI00313A1F7E
MTTPTEDEPGTRPGTAGRAAPAKAWFARAMVWLWLAGLLTLAGAAADRAHPLVAMGVLLCAVLGTLCVRRDDRQVVQAPAPEPEPPQASRPPVEAPVAALVAALPEPALLLSPDGEILVANERVGLAIGAARVGDPLSFLVRVPEVLAAVRAAAQDGFPRRVEFAERVPLDRWLEAHVVPLHLYSAKGRDSGVRGAADAAARIPAPDAVLLTFRDLTQQRRVEQMRADFVANASHELRTPLASLSGFIETLLGPARNDAPARERFLTIMGAQARRMSRLIDDLLSLSRIELNAHVRPDTPVDLGGILSHVCDTLTPLANDRGVVIELTRETRPLVIRGDRDELIRLFENLVENALKYGVTGKRVAVDLACEAGPAGPVAVISIRDFGPGIAPEHLPRLTERFYRVDVAASRDHGGTGLGLAIVKHIVARHRGRLGVESTPGEGAKFTVRLDVFDEAAKNQISAKA